MENCPCPFHRRGGAAEFACDAPRRPLQGGDLLLELNARRRLATVGGQASYGGQADLSGERSRACCPFHGSGGTWAAPCSAAALLAGLRFRRAAHWIIQSASGRDLTALLLSRAPTAAQALSLIREQYPAFANEFSRATQDLDPGDLRDEMFSLARQLLSEVGHQAVSPGEAAVFVISPAGDQEAPPAPLSMGGTGATRARLQELARQGGPLLDLWLDDVRDPVRNGAAGFLWAKTAAQAIAMLGTGAVRFASLDHDLDAAATIGLPPREPTGYDVVTWMEQTNSWPPRGVRIHSMNPAGAQRMRQVVMRHYGRTF